MSISIGGEEKFKSEPNVVPLCDVLLVLLIIFMIVTPMVQRGVELNLPAALNTVNLPENPDVVLYVKKDGTLYLNQEQVNMDNLQGKLEEAYLSVQDEKLYLRADSDVEYGKLVDLIALLKDAGIEDVAIVTDKKAEKID